MTDHKYHYWKWTKQDQVLKSNRHPTAPGRHDALQSKSITPSPSKGGEIQIIRDPPNDKRALSNQRISNRYMIIQKSINPYVPTENYIDDLEVQDKFLRPKDSNIKEVE